MERISKEVSKQGLF